MKKIYKIYDKPDGKGNWYKAYDVSDDFPLDYSFTDIPLDTSLRFPRFILGQGWVEDKDSLIEALSTDLEVANNSIMDLMEMVSQLGGDANV